MDKCEKLWLRLKENSPQSVFMVHICEPTSHSRTEWENSSCMLERCIGFLGIAQTQYTCEEIVSLRAEFGAFIEQNIHILNECGIQVSEPIVIGGIKWEVSDFV